jgi:hypothetical protein
MGPSYRAYLTYTPTFGVSASDSVSGSVDWVAYEDEAFGHVLVGGPWSL